MDNVILDKSVEELNKRIDAHTIPRTGDCDFTIQWIKPAVEVRILRYGVYKKGYIRAVVDGEKEFSGDVRNVLIKIEEYLSKYNSKGELKKRLKELEIKRDNLEMKDNWNSSDFEEREAIQRSIYKVQRLLKEEK